MLKSKKSGITTMKLPFSDCEPCARRREKLKKMARDADELVRRETAAILKKIRNARKKTSG